MYFRLYYLNGEKEDDEGQVEERPSKISSIFPNVVFSTTGLKIWDSFCEPNQNMWIKRVHSISYKFFYGIIAQVFHNSSSAHVHVDIVIVVIIVVVIVVIVIVV